MGASASRRGRRDVIRFEHGTYIVRPATGNRWRVISWDPTSRRQIERTATSEGEAREKARDLETFKAAHIELHTNGRTIAVLAAETVTALARAGRSPRYLEKIEGCARRWIVPVIGHLPVATWSPADSEDVLAGACPVVGRARLQDIGATMRAMVSVAQKKRWLPLGPQHDPMYGVTYTAQPTQQGQEPYFVDIAMLPTLAQCRAQETAIGEALGDHWRVGLHLVREAMLRWGEWIALRPCDITFERPATHDDLNEGRARIVGETTPWRAVAVTAAIEETADGATRRKDTKNRQHRSASFAAHLDHDLRAVVNDAARTRGADAPIWTRADGSAPSRRWWQRVWARAYRHAALPLDPDGRPRWTVHDWRDVGACTWLFDRRADPGAVSYAIGHATVAFTLARYTSHRGPAIATLTAAGDTPLAPDPTAPPRPSTDLAREADDPPLPNP